MLHELSLPLAHLVVASVGFVLSCYGYMRKRNSYLIGGLFMATASTFASTVVWSLGLGAFFGSLIVLAARSGY